MKLFQRRLASTDRSSATTQLVTPKKVIVDNRPQAAVQRRIQHSINAKAPIQRIIKEGTAENNTDWLKEHIKIYETINKLKEQVAENKYEIHNTSVYKAWAEKMNKRLDKVANLNTEFEQTKLSGFKTYDNDDRSLKTDMEFMNWDLAEYKDQITKFWQGAARANNVRTRLRSGSLKIQANPRANVPELYAGTFEESKEILEGKGKFAKLINDNTWFTDSDGAVFVRHKLSRSAGIGLSPAGKPRVMLHIGHKHNAK